MLALFLSKKFKWPMRFLILYIVADMFLDTIALGLLTPIEANAAVIPDNPSGSTVAEIAAGDTMVNNWGIVTVNNGEISFNVGTVDDNNGEVVHNFGTVTDNAGGVVGTNHKDGTVGTDAAVRGGQGTVTNNYGLVRNADEVGTNYYEGSVTNAGVVGDNFGSVDSVGTVTGNYREAINPGEVVNNYTGASVHTTDTSRSDFVVEDYNATDSNAIVGDTYDHVVYHHNDGTNYGPRAAEMSIRDGASAPVQPQAPEPFTYVPNENSDPEYVMGEDLARILNLDANVDEIFVSPENMTKSTLFVTLEDIGPVGVVNLGQEPEITLDMLKAMLVRGGFFGFLKGDKYYLLNFNGEELRNVSAAIVGTPSVGMGSGIVKDGEDAKSFYQADPHDIAESAGTIRVKDDDDDDEEYFGDPGTYIAPGGIGGSTTLIPSGGDLGSGSGVAGVRESSGERSGRRTATTSGDASGVLGVRTAEDQAKTESDIATPAPDKSAVTIPASLDSTPSKGKGKVVKIKDNEIPLAERTFEEDSYRASEGILFLLSLGIVGRKMYDDIKKRREEEEARRAGF